MTGNFASNLASITDYFVLLIEPAALDVNSNRYEKIFLLPISFYADKHMCFAILTVHDYMVSLSIFSMQKFL